MGDDHRIEIDGFKSFEDFALELPPFTVLVGANASGKSNMLEAVDLLAHLIREPTGQTLVDHARRGGPKDLFRRGPDGEPVDMMRIAADVIVDGELRVTATVQYTDPPDPLRVSVVVENARDYRHPGDDEPFPQLPEAVLHVEEPENGLHPSRVPTLLSRLRGRVSDLKSLTEGHGRQTLVTTHSPVALAAALEEAPDSVIFLDSVTRFGDGQSPRRVTRARPVAQEGERGTFVTPVEVRKYLDRVGRFSRGA
ncbi:AAA family ATPase [Streptomyces sp. B15]|uniref:AAA family ATPase n=1 Tax=Streptomyces sp. B15 TaxID=1537797 RepID=UPI001B374F0A|nr:AAA family ATPase [Streptomyces sp. B15]MBQ1121828.1 AAA family ATPase [Streptomyces sp. B15]